MTSNCLLIKRSQDDMHSSTATRDMQNFHCMSVVLAHRITSHRQSKRKKKKKRTEIQASIKTTLFIKIIVAFFLIFKVD